MDVHHHRRRGIINWDSLRAKVIIAGTIAGSITAIWFIISTIWSFSTVKANAYIDTRATCVATSVIDKRIEPVYRMATETRYILDETVDSEKVARAMRRMRDDSLRRANHLMIIGR